MATKPSLNLAWVSAVIVLDIEGRRLFSKYYQASMPSTQKDQKTFEKALFEKTKNNPNGEIILFEGNIAVYKNSLDVFVYVVGSADENELLLWFILEVFLGALELVYKTPVEKRVILEGLDLAFLTLDETLEDGIMMHFESKVIASRVTKAKEDDMFNLGAAGNIPIGDQTLTQAIKTAREQFVKSLLK